MKIEFLSYFVIFHKIKINKLKLSMAQVELIMPKMVKVLLKQRLQVVERGR